MSSLAAHTASAATTPPVQTPSRVSKEEPTVSTVTVPLEGAVQVNQTDAPPALPAWSGSPASLVAPALEPDALPEAPLSAWPEAKASFAGPAARATAGASS